MTHEMNVNTPKETANDSAAIRDLMNEAGISNRNPATPTEQLNSLAKLLEQFPGTITEGLSVEEVVEEVPATEAD